MRDADTTIRSETGDTFRRFGRWLSARPIESWGFFAAGILIARILF
tara:strand:- start:165 stop:302 length:138 start_codon:yes stop_codon:yes gene_type:complete